MAEQLKGPNPVGKPWCTLGTSMRPNVLLMCKLLYILLLLHTFQNKIQDPFLPFIPALDLLRTWPGLFSTLLKTVFFGAGFCANRVRFYQRDHA